MTFNEAYMTCKWCSVYASSANGLICSRNVVAKLLSTGSTCFGSEGEPVRVCGRKSRAPPFLSRITVACLPAHGKHPGLCGQMKKLSATFSNTQSRLFRALGQGKLWSRIRNLAPTFLLTDESVCTAGLLRPPFIRCIRFITG